MSKSFILLYKPDYQLKAGQANEGAPHNEQQLLKLLDAQPHSDEPLFMQPQAELFDEDPHVQQFIFEQLFVEQSQHWQAAVEQSQQEQLGVQQSQHEQFIEGHSHADALLVKQPQPELQP